MRLTTSLLQRYFKRFVQRKQMEAKNVVEWYKPVTGWKRVGRIDNWYYNEHRPWTETALQYNRAEHKRPDELLRPIKEWKIFKGDRVEILTGKSKGKQGIICSIVHERNWVFVEGLHLEHKWDTEGNSKDKTMRSQEKPLMVDTEVSLIDPSDSKPTEVEWRYDEKGERVRTSVRTGRIIPLPKAAHFYEDGFIDRTIYKESPKDTPTEELEKITFTPKLCTFEQDIFNEFGIKDDRVRRKTYWY